MSHEISLPNGLAIALLEASTDPCAIFAHGSSQPAWRNQSWQNHPSLASGPQLPFVRSIAHRLDRLMASPKKLTANAPIFEKSIEKVSELSMTATILTGLTEKGYVAAVSLTGGINTPHASSTAPITSQRDDLTGLPGRNFLASRLEEMQRRKQTGQPCDFAVLFVDLDGFKAVNDNAGHVVGDRVLAEVSSRLANVIRGGDAIARFGGDEFVILAEGITQLDEAAPLVDRLRTAAKLPVEIESHKVSLSASIGVALSSEPWQSLNDLVALADARMYADKQSG